MQLIHHPSADFEPCRKLKECPTEEATIIGFESFGKIYLLTCVASGKATRVKVPLWGFVCLTTPVTPVNYLADSAYKAIDEAVAWGKRSVFLYDSLAELLASGGGMQEVPPTMAEPEEPEIKVGDFVRWKSRYSRRIYEVKGFSPCGKFAEGFIPTLGFSVNLRVADIEKCDPPSAPGSNQEFKSVLAAERLRLANSRLPNGWKLKQPVACS